MGSRPAHRTGPPAPRPPRGERHWPTSRLQTSLPSRTTSARTARSRRRLFKAGALVTGRRVYDEAEADCQGFWARQAADLLTWFEDWNTVLEWDLPFAKWFVGGKLNVSYNCLDRHVAAGRGDKVAYHWEGEPGDTRTLTYADLLDEVQRFANVLKGLGVAKGDRVAIYMPMIPELPVAMLACARIGAPHSVVFGGFSADSLSDRINDAECKVVDHRRRRLRRGAVPPAQAQRRRGAGRRPRRRARRRRGRHGTRRVSAST